MTDPTVIANQIKQVAMTLDFPSLLKDKKRSATSAIIGAFGERGRDLHYRVSCHQADYQQADDGEWLYDMVWWLADEEKLLIRMPMVLEVELNRGAGLGDDVDADFQKLVQARADVRVWITTSPHDAPLHIKNCKDQIRQFVGTTLGDRYLFVVYDWTSRQSLIEEFVVL